MNNTDYLHKFLLDPNGPLSRVIPNFEIRPREYQMAEAVDKAIFNKTHLITEAGAGVGKSLAYLLPSIHYLEQKKLQTVVVSTYTKTLQKQLLKDLSLLREKIFPALRFARALGGWNYLCPRKLLQSKQLQLYDNARETSIIGQISESWQYTNPSGVKDDFPFNIPNKTWSRISYHPTLCLGKTCNYSKNCPHYKAREKWRNSSLLIVNHALFLANLKSAEKILPPYDMVVLDEAHHLEQVARENWGIQLINVSIKQFFDSLYNSELQRSSIPIVNRLPTNEKGKFVDDIATVKSATMRLFEERGQNQPFRFRKENHQPQLIHQSIVSMLAQTRGGFRADEISV